MCDYITSRELVEYSTLYNRKVHTLEHIVYSSSATSREFRFMNRFHNIRNPAVITYYQNGQKDTIYYYNNGKHHNSNGPALIAHFDNGMKRCEIYYNNDKLHNTNGPARIIYSITGKKIREEFYINDDLVREIDDRNVYYKEKSYTYICSHEV